MLTLEDPLMVVWCPDHQTTPPKCTPHRRRGVIHPPGQPVKVIRHPDRGQGAGYGHSWHVASGPPERRFPLESSLLDLWIMLVGHYNLPHQQVSEAFAVVKEWRELEIGGYRVFLPGRYDQMNFHNPDRDSEGNPIY